MLTVRLLTAAALAVAGCSAQDLLAFPDDFKFGVATAAYQIEGAWNVSGKGKSIWDVFTHEHPEWIVDGSNGDVACDSYHHLDEDVAMLQQLGVNFYRFSFSWTRILPEGRTDQINDDGIRYYNDLIDRLIAAGIEPVASMYHWDLPSPLQDLGGWPNNFTADFFVQYARVLFENFGDQVKWWNTFNEPKETTRGYGEDDKAPRVNMHGIGEYLSAHTILLAHARTYHMYDEEFRAAQGGRVGITLNQDVCIPLNDTQENIDAAERCNQFEVYPEGLRIIINWVRSQYGDLPILVTGNGYSDRGELNDVGRRSYYRGYLRQLLLAIHEDGANVIGYITWSLMDNFEWLQGYTERFGLYYVDFDDDNRPRTPKGSAELYRQIVATHQVPEDPAEETRARSPGKLKGH